MLLLPYLKLNRIHHQYKDSTNKNLIQKCMGDPKLACTWINATKLWQKPPSDGSKLMVTQFAKYEMEKDSNCLC